MNLHQAQLERIKIKLEEAKSGRSLEACYQEVRKDVLTFMLSSSMEYIKVAW